jgi:hypothetical protein
MIFGIKTKKDKKIEELQKEIDKLKFQPPKIIEQPIQCTTIGASYIVDKWDKAIVQESWIKGILANMLTKELIKRGLPIEKTKMDNGDVEYKVRLKVILDDIYRN